MSCEDCKWWSLAFTGSDVGECSNPESMWQSSYRTTEDTCEEDTCKEYALLAAARPDVAGRDMP